jgi:hypothetical protein
MDPLKDLEMHKDNKEGGPGVTPILDFSLLFFDVYRPKEI